MSLGCYMGKWPKIHTENDDIQKQTWSWHQQTHYLFKNTSVLADRAQSRKQCFLFILSSTT